MKTVEVAAGIVVLGSKVLAAERTDGAQAGGWEFPGGKVEPGETPEQALVRELHEELGITVGVGELLVTVEHDYPSFHLIMHCYRCRIDEGEPALREHAVLRWLASCEFDDVAWLPADVKVIEALKARGV